jgi:hypothetical protein
MYVDDESLFIIDIAGDRNEESDDNSPPGDERQGGPSQFDHELPSRHAVRES